MIWTFSRKTLATCEIEVQPHQPALKLGRPNIFLVKTYLLKEGGENTAYAYCIIAHPVNDMLNEKWMLYTS